jgi:hypothetical protein
MVFDDEWIMLRMRRRLVASTQHASYSTSFIDERVASSLDNDSVKEHTNEMTPLADEAGIPTKQPNERIFSQFTKSTNHNRN